MPRSLDIVARLRRHAVDAARQDLAAALQAEARAALAVRAADAAIQAEQEAASRLDASDALAEAFGRWLPRGRLVLEIATETLTRAEDAASRARACLSAARTAAEAVAQLQAERRAAARAAEVRAAQRELDEAARHRVADL